MAFEAHPKSFRLKRNKDWNSRWLAEKKVPQFLEEDFEIRKFLRKKFKDCGIEKIEIERFPGQISIFISTSRPGYIIGRKGKGVRLLRQAIKSKILKRKIKLKIEIKPIKKFWASAPSVAQWIAGQIEKRIPHRRVLKSALSRIMASEGVKGAKVQVKGRLNGATIARKSWLKRGELPRQKIRAKFDFGTAQAFCTYGVIGVEVWIYKGEKF